MCLLYAIYYWGLQVIFLNNCISTVMASVLLTARKSINALNQNQGTNSRESRTNSDNSSFKFHFSGITFSIKFYIIQGCQKSKTTRMFLIRWTNRCVYVYMFVCECLRLHIHTFISIFTSMYAHKHMYVCIHICAYVYIHKC